MATLLTPANAHLLHALQQGPRAACAPPLHRRRQRDATLTPTHSNSYRGRVVATLHRVNTTLIPAGESRVSLPFFLLPKMEGALEPFFDPSGNGERSTGYKASA